MDRSINITTSTGAHRVQNDENASVTHQNYLRSKQQSLATGTTKPSNSQQSTQSKVGSTTVSSASSIPKRTVLGTVTNRINGQNSNNNGSNNSNMKKAVTSPRINVYVPNNTSVLVKNETSSVNTKAESKTTVTKNSVSSAAAAAISVGSAEFTKQYNTNKESKSVSDSETSNQSSTSFTEQFSPNDSNSVHSPQSPSSVSPKLRKIHQELLVSQKKVTLQKRHHTHLQQQQQQQQLLQEQKDQHKVLKKEKELVELKQVENSDSENVEKNASGPDSSDTEVELEEDDEEVFGHKKLVTSFQPGVEAKENEPQNSTTSISDITKRAESVHNSDEDSDGVDELNDGNTTTSRIATQAQINDTPESTTFNNLQSTTNPHAMFPVWNNSAKTELKIAANVYSNRNGFYLDEEDEDTYDISMVIEYGEEIFVYMRDLENKFKPNPSYMDAQTEIQWSMRSILVDWLVQVHQRFNLLPETLFLTINYVDRFLSLKDVSLSKLQLVGAVALFVAAKFEEISCPTVQEIAYMVDHGYPIEEILRAERYMIDLLDFNLAWPGPMSFLRRTSKADDYDVETRTLAKYLLEITIMDQRFVASPPSWLAAGSHCLARRMLHRGEWTQAHVFYSGYTLKQLEPLMVVLLECCKNPKKHHKAIFEKYADRKFRKASVFVADWMAGMYF
ncbi:hypothetical protein NADFUDRAFT_64663 [Nadsonia fulvescens var. elongata DSM 6958]|uniref:Uncharacterized protein n=1 Tax=Nadsonia fulvescens var. elongata DSM 6958 TaxID=857566 RepID=A0A1E3PQ52_9ASCO|nr:hypothetical protein NADFUDRAFT_64663 [Nadsonia fulvescens var. elongata DSM 6958]